MTEAKHNPFSYTVSIELPLDLDAVKQLITASQHHYDGTCKAAGQCGGVFYGWHNSLMFAADAESDDKPYATFRQLDLACKVLEMHCVIDGSTRAALFMKLRRAMVELESEYARLTE